MSEDIQRETEFVRHRSNGKPEIIHRWGCGAVKNMKNPLGWNWADEHHPDEWLFTHDGRFRPCERCCADLAQRVESARA